MPCRFLDGLPVRSDVVPPGDVGVVSPSSWDCIEVEESCDGTDEDVMITDVGRVTDGEEAEGWFTKGDEGPPLFGRGDSTAEGGDREVVVVFLFEVEGRVK